MTKCFQSWELSREARTWGEMARERLITSRESLARCMSSVSSPRQEEGEGDCRIRERGSEGRQFLSHLGEGIVDGFGVRTERYVAISSRPGQQLNAPHHCCIRQWSH